MSGVRRRFVALAVLIAVMTGGGIAGAVTIPFTREPLAESATVGYYDPQMDGELVVWTRRAVSADTSQYIDALNLSTGETQPIGHGAADQLRADVSSERVAYQEGNEDDGVIRIHDLRTSFDYALTDGDVDEVAPRIDGNLVVWLDRSTYELRYRDLDRGFGGTVPGATYPTSLRSYDVDNGRIVCAGGSGLAVRMYTPATDTSVLLYSVTSGDIESARIHGDRVALTTDVAVTNRDAMILDVRDLSMTNMNPDSSLDEMYPSVFHKGVAWEHRASADFDVLFRLLGDAPSAAAEDDGASEADPALFGRRIVYRSTPVMEPHQVWMATSTPESARTSGPDRYATAVEVSKAYFSKAEDAVLCTGLNFPDALSAAPLARILGAPLLLSRTDAVDAATIAELKRLDVKKIWIIGGTGAISAAVETQLASEGFADRERIDGADRYATSAKIAETMADLLSERYAPSLAFFARGDDFPDALAVGPVAAGAYAPILLVRTGSIPPSILDAVDALGLTSGFVVGGTSAVSDAVQDDLRQLMVGNGGDPFDTQLVERWSGENRYETAEKIVEGGLQKRWIDLDTLGIATGLNFPDALGGGAALGYYGSALLLTRADSLPGNVKDFLDENAYRIGRVDVFGGTSVVSETVKTEVHSYLK